jgi:hypothetical protein
VAGLKAGGWIVDPDDTGPPVIRSVSRLEPDNPSHIGLQSRTEW